MSTRRALALIRVSKERDGMTSPDVQRHAIDTLARQHSIRILEYVEGIDESGSREESAWWPRLDQAIARMEAREIDTILVWKFSRVGRARLPWAVALNKVDTLGGQIISATEPIETRTASGRMARGFLGEINAYQADLIGEGWTEALERRVRSGLPGTGRPRFGYHWDGTYTVDDQLAPTVRAMYARVIGGQGFTAIARWLNEQGLRSRFGNLWHPTHTKQFMDRGFAAGLIWSKGVYHPGAHEPIIDRETWEAYLARRAGMKRPPRGSVRMLSGLLKCGTCGHSMAASKTTATGGGYLCQAKFRGHHCEHPMYITRTVAEKVVDDWVRHLDSNPQLLADAKAAEARQRMTAIEDRAAIGRLIRRAEERLTTLTLKLVDEKISQTAYDVAAGRLNTELDGLRARHALAAPRPQSNLLAEIPAFVGLWEGASPQVQNRVARALIDRIIVHAGIGPSRLQIVEGWGTTK